MAITSHEAAHVYYIYLLNADIVNGRPVCNLLFIF